MDNNGTMENNGTLCYGPCGNGRGLYVQGCYCSCYQGFFGYNCQDNLTSLYPSSFPAVRILITIGFFICTLFWFFAFLLYVRRGYAHFAHLANKSIIITIVSGFLYDFGTFLEFSIDFDGSLTYPWVIGIWQAIATVYGFLFLGAILSFWIELVHFTEKQFAKAKAFQKINKNYDPHITLADMAKHIGKMNKFRIPFLSCVIYISIVQIVYLALVISYNPLYQILVIINIISNVLIFLFYTIAFIVYERRMTNILDTSLLPVIKQVKDTGRKVRIYCVVSIFSSIFFNILGILVEGPVGLYAVHVIVAVEEWIVTFIIISIHINFGDWSKFFLMRLGLLSEESEKGSSTLRNDDEMMTETPSEKVVIEAKVEDDTEDKQEEKSA